VGGTKQEGGNNISSRLQTKKGYKAASYKATRATWLLVKKNIAAQPCAHKGPADIYLKCTLEFSPRCNGKGGC
jgi:hypothetical protein